MPNDFGPPYFETDMHHFPVEPWNTFSNLIFLALFFYWASKTRFHFRSQPLLTLSLPILLIGYVGGTVYHATRSHNLWLVLDFVPISVLCLMVAYAYWKKIFGRHWKVLAFVLSPVVLARFGLQALDLSRNANVTSGYALLGALVLTPLFLFAGKAPSKASRLKGIAWRATAFLGVALVFRVADMNLPPSLTPVFWMGTHWLWHLFGGGATFFAMQFVYEAEAEWRARHDSNVRPSPSEGDTLIQLSYGHANENTAEKQGNSEELPENPEEDELPSRTLRSRRVDLLRTGTASASLPYFL